MRGKGRAPTKQEIAEVSRYYRQFSEPSETAAEDVEYLMGILFIAVFDDYITRGYQGKLIATISIEGIVELLIWDAEGNLESFFCSG